MRLGALVAIVLYVGVSPLASADEKDDEWNKLMGDWEAISIQINGVNLPADMVKHYRYTITKGKMVRKYGRDWAFSPELATIDLTKQPKEIDFEPTTGWDRKGHVDKSIYEFSGDTLKIAFGEPGKERPAKFASPEGSHSFYVVLRKVK